jgi:toxin-antitoxin system PIN domain toxin
MSVYLPDVNVLVALFWTNHEHHQEASAWFRRRQRSGWATCPLTQAGFVRVSSNPRVFPDAPSPAKVVELLRTNLNHPAHRFIKDEITFSDAVKPFSDRFSGYQQATDAYLLGLAIHKRGVLATFDRSIAALADQNPALLKALEIL